MTTTQPPAGFLPRVLRANDGTVAVEAKSAEGWPSAYQLVALGPRSRALLEALHMPPYPGATLTARILQSPRVDGGGPSWIDNVGLTWTELVDPADIGEGRAGCRPSLTTTTSSSP